MEWLLTVKSDVSLDQIDALLAGTGYTRTDTPPIPLGDDEQVIEVSGPRGLSDIVESEDWVLRVSPNSTMTYY